MQHHIEDQDGEFITKKNNETFQVDLKKMNEIFILIYFYRTIASVFLSFLTE